MSKNRTMAYIAALLAFLVALTGCSSSGTSNGSPEPEQFDATSDSTCFTALDPQQEKELRAYADQNKDVVKETASNTGGQNVCVLESDGNGGYNQRYYQKEDENKFDDYLLYSLLLGNSNALLTYGALSGDLDLGQVMALSLLTGVNNQGQMYHPYSRPSSGNSWVRTPATMNSNVRGVAYGRTAKPLVFDNTKMLPVPPGFTKKPVPTVSDKTVEYAKGSNGRPVVKSQSNTGAREKITALTPPAPRRTNPPQSGTTGNQSGSTPRKGGATKRDSVVTPAKPAKTGKK